jgi:hypothetical protein
MPLWHGKDGTTRAYDWWFGRERELRAFVKFGLAFGEDGLQQRWNEIEQRPSDGSEETIDVFDRELDGLGPTEFEWMLLAAGVRDAVTLYEGYLEQAFDEVLLRHGAERVRPLESPYWNELCDYYALVGIDLDADSKVSHARRLRHLLTHRRGAVETEQDQRAYGTAYPFAIASVELTQNGVIDLMDGLAVDVERVDAITYEYAWGPRRIPNLVIRPAADAKSG